MGWSTHDTDDTLGECGVPPVLRPHSPLPRTLRSDLCSLSAIHYSRIRPIDHEPPVIEEPRPVYFCESVIIANRSDKERPFSVRCRYMMGNAICFAGCSIFV
jgi:hypothetical protein